MPVIALTQEMGSLAKDVALRLGELGKLTVLANEVAENIAGRMQVPHSLVRRLREGKAGFRERRSADPRDVAAFTAEEVFAQAERGNVVLRGWGATVLLRPVRHVLRVRVTRPFAARVQWVMDNTGLDDRAAAEDEVQRSDSAHTARMQSLFNVTWGDPLLYDVVVNTDRLSVDTCAETILQMAGHAEFQETAESREVLSGLALSARVRAALRANSSTSNVDVHVQAKAGRATLSGIVVDPAEKVEAARIASTVAGVGNVDDQLRVMKITRKFAHSKTS
jgi:osmotically-inducible protein OsmY